MDDLGLFEGICRLFTDSYQIMVVRLGVAVPRAPEGGAADLEALDDGEPEPPVAIPVPPPDQERDAQARDPDPVAGASDWAQKNSHYRKLTLRGVSGDGPLAEWILIRPVLRPHVAWMNSLLR